MPAKSNSTPVREKGSLKCPVCFHKTSCTHANKIIGIINPSSTSSPKENKPFLGCYNRKLYKDLKQKINEQFIPRYNTFIIDQIEKFHAQLQIEKSLLISPSLSYGGFTKERYVDQLMKYFYKPIEDYAKRMAFVAYDDVLSIKQEKHSSSPQVNGNHEEEERGEESSILEESSKYHKIRKATPMKDNRTPPKSSSPLLDNYKQHSTPLINDQTTLSTPAITMVIISNKTKKTSDSLLLSEKDFKNLEGFLLALRRGLKLGVGDEFHQLQYTCPATKKHVQVNESAMVVLGHLVKHNQQPNQAIKFRYW